MNKTYTFRLDDGYEEDIHAKDIDEAVEIAEKAVEAGDWGPEGASVLVEVIEYEEGNETDSRAVRVEIEPDHAYLISEATRRDRERSCGDSPDDHDWTSEGEGGCDSNPGVWSIGGTSILYRTHCRVCGLSKEEVHVGPQKNPGDHDTVVYHMPKTWCSLCEREVCRCKECR